MSFLTCFWLLPQKEHFSRSAVSPMRATCHVLSQAKARTRAVRCRVSHSTGHTGDRRGSDGCSLQRVEDLVDEPVLDGLLGGEDLVALDVAADVLGALPGRVGDHLLRQGAHQDALV